MITTQYMVRFRAGLNVERVNREYRRVDVKGKTNTEELFGYDSLKGVMMYIDE